MKPFILYSDLFNQQMAAVPVEPLTDAQRRVITEISRGRNVFMTGQGGTGKTHTIKAIIEYATTNAIPHALTSLTGCSAHLLGPTATTLHSWAGIGLGTAPLDKLILNINRKKKLRTKWQKTELLIVDEISMMDAPLFELLDAIGRAIRKTPDKPFGGLQLLFSGDFFQLPPVSNNEFCFESLLWPITFSPECQIELTTIFRQTDPQFIKILKQIRAGRISKKSDALLKSRLNLTYDDLPFPPTILCPVKRSVQAKNDEELAKIKLPAIQFKLTEHTNLPLTAEIDRRVMDSAPKTELKAEMQRLKNTCNMPDEINLKVGAKVMCTQNMPALKMHNGSQGIITSIHYPMVDVRFSSLGEDDRIITIAPHIIKSENYPALGISQIPLILAWAITIHKSQGMTLDYVEIDIGSDIFEAGQSYVAVSRAKFLAGLYIKSYDHTKLITNPKVRKFYAELSAIE